MHFTKPSELSKQKQNMHISTLEWDTKLSERTPKKSSKLIIKHKLLSVLEDKDFFIETRFVQVYNDSALNGNFTITFSDVFAVTLSALTYQSLPEIFKDIHPST